MLLDMPTAITYMIYATRWMDAVELYLNSYLQHLGAHMY